MTRDARQLPPPPGWLADWLREAGEHCQCRSLVLAASRQADLTEISSAVAAYLNEFDCEGGNHWRSFGLELLSLLAADPASRELLLAGVEPHASQPVRPDLQRIARRLARLGGVILEGPEGLDATADLPGTFHVCLSGDQPADHLRFHMWINPRRFSLKGLVCVIADSFLNWTCHAAPLPQPLPESPLPHPPHRES